MDNYHVQHNNSSNKLGKEQKEKMKLPIFANPVNKSTSNQVADVDFNY